MSTRKAMIIMKTMVSSKAVEESKNSAQVGPVGQTRLVSSTLCDAGFPTYIPSFLIEAISDKVSMISERKDSRKAGVEHSLYSRELRRTGHAEACLAALRFRLDAAETRPPSPEELRRNLRYLVRAS